MSKRSNRRGSRQQNETKARITRRADVQAPPHQALTTVGLVLAACGLLLTGYLTYTNLFDTHAGYCGAGSSCDLVQVSGWSTLLGVPLPALGFATYAIIGTLLVRFRRLRRSWLTLFCVTVFGVVFSSYLTAVSIFEIEATCGYCLTFYAVLAALLVVMVMTCPQQLPTDRGVALTLLGNLRSGGWPRRSRIESAHHSSQRLGASVVRRLLVPALSGTKSTVRSICRPPALSRVPS